MHCELARAEQIPTGALEARDLAPGDLVLIRPTGGLEPEPHTVVDTAAVYGEVAVAFDWGHVYLHPTKRVPLA